MFVQIPDTMKKLFVYAALSVLPFVAAGERTEYELEYSPFGEEVLAGDVWDVSRLAVEDSRSKAFAGIGLRVSTASVLAAGSCCIFSGVTRCCSGAIPRWRIEGLLNDSLTVVARFPLAVVLPVSVVCRSEAGAAMWPCRLSVHFAARFVAQAVLSALWPTLWAV